MLLMVTECNPALISELKSSHSFSIYVFHRLLYFRRFIQGVAKDFIVFEEEKQMVPERQALQTLQ